MDATEANAVAEGRRPKGRPGRPRIGNLPMTANERKRRSRALLRQAGHREFCLTLGGPHLAVIDQLAKSGGMAPAAVLTALVGEALFRVQIAIEEGKFAAESGQPLDQALRIVNSYYEIDDDTTGGEPK